MRASAWRGRQAAFFEQKSHFDSGLLWVGDVNNNKPRRRNKAVHCWGDGEESFGVLPAGAHESRRHLFHQVRAQCELNWPRLQLKYGTQKTIWKMRRRLKMEKSRWFLRLLLYGGGAIFNNLTTPLAAFIYCRRGDDIWKSLGSWALKCHSPIWRSKCQTRQSAALPRGLMAFRCCNWNIHAAPSYARMLIFSSRSLAYIARHPAPRPQINVSI